MTAEAAYFWEPDLRFAGQTVFVVGGGPSLRGFDFERLRGRRVIATNAAGYDVPFADILLFHDNSWFEANRALVEGWAGLAVTVSRHAKNALPERLARIAISNEPGFRVGRGPVRSGRSSGQTAVALAIAMGAAQVILLGFDMRADAGVTHYHTDRPLYTVEHMQRAAADYASNFLPGWRGWNAAAQAAGCLVLNATPGSALLEFPPVDLDDILPVRT